MGATIGGSVESVAIRGRIFPVAADADGNRKLGGFELEAQANGDGSVRYVATRVPWKMDGLSLEMNDDRGDQEFLQDIIDGMEPVPCEFTFVTGVTFRGEGMPTGELQSSTMNATAPLTFEGGGKLEQ
jgi:hypothetical protein